MNSLLPEVSVASKKPGNVLSHFVRSSVVNQLLLGAVALSSTLLILETTTGGVSSAIRNLYHAAGNVGGVTLVALLLNVSLILFSWRRHKDVQALLRHHDQAEQRAKALETKDALTNLLLRRSLIDEGDRLVAAAGANGMSTAMIVLNVDNFKKINDIYGHIAGDSLLRAIADALLRVAPNALCARVGGDEFAISVPFSQHDQGKVTALAQDMLTLLSRPFHITSVPIHVTASAGIAKLAPDCASSEGLLRRANIALRAARKVSGGRAVWFDNSMESVLRARNEVERGLRDGIPRGEFAPYYQQQRDLRTGRICGFEVLARWHHPAGGVADPDLFISVAEETGLIGELFESIFRQALHDAHQWDASLALSVNVSPVQLKDPLLAHRLLRVLNEAAFPANRLEIEITETSLFENLAIAQSIAETLSGRGIKLALDDFGTGYSSLAHLRALPFDRIKIDRSFVQSMMDDKESAAIVRAVTMMAESLGVAVTAEGVEDEKTQALVRRIGCDKAQGWLYGKALPAKDVFQLLAPQNLLSPSATGSGASCGRGTSFGGPS